MPIFGGYYELEVIMKKLLTVVCLGLSISSQAVDKQQWAGMVFTDTLPEDLKKLGEQAQVTAGVPKEKRLPAYNVDKLSTFGLVTNNVLGGPKLFGINNNLLQFAAQKEYGARRFIILHEAHHIKHDDANNITYSVGRSLTTSTLAINIALKKLGIGKSRYFVATSCGLTISLLAIECWKKNVEKRADTEGWIALQCAPCAQEFLNNTFMQSITSNPQRTQLGYLSYEELEKLSKEHHIGKTCEYHKPKSKLAGLYEALKRVF